MQTIDQRYQTSQNQRAVDEAAIIDTFRDAGWDDSTALGYLVAFVAEHGPYLSSLLLHDLAEAIADQNTPDWDDEGEDE